MSVAPASDPAVGRLRQVRDLASLITYLHEELDWPVGEIDIEDLTYDYTPAEVGLEVEAAEKVRSIKRLRPLTNDAPWGIFFIDFVPGELPVTVLRRILRALVIRRRASGRPDRQAWQTGDLLFVSVLGAEGDRDVSLAHFSEDAVTGRAALRVVEWDQADTSLHILRVNRELKELRWREPGETLDQWRSRWSAAFELRPREVAKTAKALASQMAQLAKFIRQRVNDAYAAEAENGTLHKLHTAFREVLIHDLAPDGFADMYAQTITYGLFAARRSRPAAARIAAAEARGPSTSEASEMAMRAKMNASALPDLRVTALTADMPKMSVGT